MDPLFILATGLAILGGVSLIAASLVILVLDRRLTRLRGDLEYQRMLNHRCTCGDDPLPW